MSAAVAQAFLMLVGLCVACAGGVLTGKAVEIARRRGESIRACAAPEFFGGVVLYALALFIAGVVHVS